MSILQTIKNNEYPEEYLITKLKSRLTEKRFDNIFSEKALQIAVIEEMKWLFYQMNSKLRKIFSKVFIYFELKTIFSALRFKLGGTGFSEELLTPSLLSSEVKDCIAKNEDILDVVTSISRIFREEALIQPPVEETFLNGGLKSFERQFVKSFLECAVKKNKEKVLEVFFKFKIDERNIISVYKILKWNIETAPELIDGGEVNILEFHKILEKKNIDDVFMVLKILTGIDVDGEHLEDLLNEGFTNKLKKMTKNIFGRLLIVEYIWKLQMEALESRKIMISQGR